MFNKTTSLTETDRDTWERYIRHIETTDGIKLRDYIYEKAVPLKLDLHGYTLHDAWGAFNEFVDAHAMAGTKQVTIVTGRSGQIKKEFSEWCRNSKSVKGANPIRMSDGGIGSFIVYLRQNRYR